MTYQSPNLEDLASRPMWTNRDMSHVLAEIRRLGAIADALLNHCDKDGGECYECSRIVCPHQCELHFHHDGCPACAMEDEREGQVIFTTKQVS